MAARSSRRRSSRRQTVRRPKHCPFKTEGITQIDYKDVSLLRKYIGIDGKIISNRATGASALMQRKLALAIKRARYLALIPYTDHHSLEK